MVKARYKPRYREGQDENSEVTQTPEAPVDYTFEKTFGPSLDNVVAGSSISFNLVATLNRNLSDGTVTFDTKGAYQYDTNDMYIVGNGSWYNVTEDMLSDNGNKITFSHVDLIAGQYVCIGAVSNTMPAAGTYEITSKVNESSKTLTLTTH